MEACPLPSMSLTSGLSVTAIFFMDDDKRYSKGAPGCINGITSFCSSNSRTAPKKALCCFIWSFSLTLIMTGLIPASTASRSVFSFSLGSIKVYTRLSSDFRAYSIRYSSKLFLVFAISGGRFSEK